MKALSVRLPWAILIAEGNKLIEFRSRPINYRGELLICVSKSGLSIWANFKDGTVLPWPKGAMVGVVKIIDCRPTTDEDLQEEGAPDSKEGWYSWIIDPEYGYLTIPKAVKGKVSLFNVDDDLIEPLEEGKTFFDYEYPNKHDKVPDDMVDLDL